MNQNKKLSFQKKLFLIISIMREISIMQNKQKWELNLIPVMIIKIKLNKTKILKIKNLN